jgi:hypothetical protein
MMIDFAARRVEGDQLLERGDPRGEMIQVCVQMAEQGSWSGAMTALWARRCELLAAHHAAWLPAPIDGIEWDFPCGLPESIKVGSNAKVFLDHASALFAVPTLRRVELYDVDGRAATRLAKLKQLPRIRELALENTDNASLVTILSARGLALEALEVTYEDLDDAGLKAILAVRGLRRLRIHHGKTGEARVRKLLESKLVAELEELELNQVDITGAALAALARKELPRLRRLSLEGNKLDAAGLRHLARAQLPALRELSLETVYLDGTQLGAVAEIPWLPALERLDLGYPSESGDVKLPPLPALTRLNIAPGDDASARLLAGLEAPQLRVLEMIVPRFGPKGMALLAAADLPSLVELSIAKGLDMGERDKPRDERAPALAKGKLLSRLETLQLDELGIGDKGARALAKSPHLSSTLRSLDLDSNPIGDAGVAALAASGKLDSLEHLSLQETRVRAAGMKALARRKQAKLIKLDLYECKIGDDGLVALAGWPGLATMKELYLTDAKIGSTSVKILARSPHAGALFSIALNQNQIRDAGARAFITSKQLGALRKLRLDGNPIGEAMRAELQRRFPDPF